MAQWRSGSTCWAALVQGRGAWDAEPKGHLSIYAARAARVKCNAGASIMLALGADAKKAPRLSFLYPPSTLLPRLLVVVAFAVVHGAYAQ